MRPALSHSSLFCSKSSLGKRNVLIVGAGIAGPVLAYFLHRFGLQPVVVERTPQLRTAGQTIDLRDAGREVARRMGIESAIRERMTQDGGVAFVDTAGRTRAAFGADSFGGRGLVSDIEIIRSELVKILYERSCHNTEYIFGDQPLSINDHGDSVQVTFASGNTREFDLVVGADGLRSRTRQLVFGDISPIHHLNIYIAYFTIPYDKADGRWSRWYNAPRGRTMFLRPDNLGTTRAVLSFRSKHRDYEDLSIESQKSLVEKLFVDAGFETPRVLAGLKNAEDFYFEAIGQVKMNRWSQGRVTLVGDAGYCASPVSGMGTTLAFVGAYILAGELGRHQDHTKAFQQYETLMRPYVTDAQKILPVAMRLTTPETRAGVALLHTAMSAVARVVNSPLFSKFTSKKSTDKISLPSYETLIGHSMTP